MFSKTHVVLACALLVAGALRLSAQSSPQQPPPSQKFPQKPPVISASQGQPTFRVESNLVTTDVIVRNKRGQFQADLEKDDFEIYEDGVRQDIVQMVLNRGGRVSNVLASPPAAAREGLILPPSRPANDAAGRIYLFFIDDLHLQFGNTARVRQMLMKMKKELLHDGDMFAIQTTGPSSVLVDLTYDLKRFDAAVEKIMGSELKPSDIIATPDSEEGPSEVLYRAHVAFSTMNDLLLAVEPVHDRRKALIYVSDGYDFNPFEKSRFNETQKMYGTARNLPDNVANDPTRSTEPDDSLWTRSSTKFLEGDLVRELADLTRTANRVNVTMYTVDPRGLVAGYDTDEQVDPNEYLDYIHKSQAGLQVLAEQTGGFAVINTNDIVPFLKRIDADTSDYYVLGYYSTNPDPLKRRRSIEVKVARPNMEVRARKEYQLKQAPRPNVKK